MHRVLIVDDLADAQLLLGALAREGFPGCSVHYADSVADARVDIDAQSFDLALVDLSLGDGSGTTVIHHLKTAQPRCLAVVATIHDGDEHLFAALQAGADGYLLKDQPSQQTLRQLQRIADGEPPLSPAVARRLMKHFQEAAAPADASQLTQREREVLALLARGLTLGEIARLLDLSRHTVGDHVKSLYRKLNISSRAEAALEARDRGLT